LGEPVAAHLSHPTDADDVQPVEGLPADSPTGHRLLRWHQQGTPQRSRRAPSGVGAVAEAGEGRARVWLLYMAGCAVLFEENEIHVDQVLAVKTPESGESSMPPRPDWR